MSTSAAVVALSAALLLGQSGVVSGDAATDQAIRRAIVQLGADEFDARQDATEFLWSQGDAAIEALQQALDSDDAEVRLRSRSILDRFRYGIFVDTPPDEVRWINRFRTGLENDQRMAFEELVKRSRLETLLALLESMESPTLRSDMQKLLLNRLDSDGRYEQLLALATEWHDEATSDAQRSMLEDKLRKLVPHLLITERTSEAEQILQQAATDDEGIRDWAVYCLLTGKLDNQIEQLKAPSTEPLKELDKRRLVFFHRVKGEKNQARQYAEQLKDPTKEILRGLLFELQDWEELADLQQQLLLGDPLGLGRNIEALGYAAAFQRLAGRQDDFENTIVAIKAVAQLRSALEWNSGEALIINRRIDEGLEILKPRMPAIAFQMLAIQERYPDAFRVAGMEKPLDDQSRWFQAVAAEITGNSEAANRQYELAVRMIEAYYRLGEHEKALEYCDILSNSVEHDRSASRLHKLCEMEARLGLWERACRHALLVMSRGRYPDPMPTLFPGHADAARVWYELLTDNNPADGRQALNAVGQMLRVKEAGKIDDETIRQRLESAADSIANADQEQQGGQWLALANTCFLHERDALGERYLEKAAATSADAALQLGKRRAKQQQWEAATHWYRNAWKLDHNQFVARYLWGHALLQQDQQEEGQALVDSAILLPLADSGARQRLAAGLKEFGFRKEAMEQWNMLLRSGGFMVSLSGKFRDTSVVDAAQNIGNSLSKDPLGRAQYWQTMHLSCLEAQLWIPSFRGYFRTPHIMHQTRAAAYLEQENIELALQEIEFGEHILPANTEFVEQLVPKLEAAGQTDAADALFQRYFQRVEKLCQAFPRSALHHNNLAWMSARCDRRLDTALQHVQRALELVPDSAAYLDTLAEVHFRRGEIDKAIDCAERCLKMEPENRFYREQLERFQQANDSKS